MANERKQAIVNAVWNDPARLFGGEWKTNGKFAEYLRGGQWNQRGALRMTQTPNGENIVLFFNHGHELAGRKEQRLFDYIMEQRGFTEYTDAERALADLYGLNLKFSEDEQQRIKRAELAQELAASLVEALRNNPNGATAQYIRNTRRLNPDGHFGELTPDSIKRALEHLRNRGISYDPKDVEALGITEQYARYGYNCVIPYTVNGKVRGFLFRNIRPDVAGKDRYRYSAGMVRGGYSDLLEYGQPAVIVEGPLDAIRLIQAGVHNVVAMGGAQMGDETARLLRGRGITTVTYVPDHETDADGRRDARNLKLTAEAIRKFTAATIEGEPVIKSLLVADLPTPDGPNKKYDADSYGAEHPDEIVGLVELGAVSWWTWELDGLTARAVAQGQPTPRNIEPIVEAFNDIYDRCVDVYERQRVRDYIATGENARIYAPYGIAPQALTDKDEWNKSREYNNEIRQGAADLNRAVEEQASPEKIRAIIDRLNDAQGANTRDEWEAQLAETFDDELEAIRNQPDTLQTRWEVGNIDKMGKYWRYERIEYYPADITVFCAPTSHGKTMILFQSAFDLLRSYPNKTFLYVSCEENKRQLTQRALNVYIDIPNTPDGMRPKVARTNANGEPNPAAYCFIQGTRKKTITAVLRGSVPPEEYTLNLEAGVHYNALTKQIRQGVNDYGKEIRPRLKFVHTEASAESICANVVHFVEAFRNNGVEVGAVFVDYMQLLSTDARNYSRHDELKDICKALRECAARIELPIVIAAQLNREVLRQPIDNVTEANIGEGADIERIAHDILFVWQVDRTPVGLYTSTPSGGKNNVGPVEPQVDASKLGPRSIRLFTKPRLGGNEPRELKQGYIYVEQMKARDGRSGGWGLFPYDGERGKIGEIDTDEMKR